MNAFAADPDTAKPVARAMAEKLMGMSQTGGNRVAPTPYSLPEYHLGVVGNG
jgi:hypothetical protein